MAKNIEDFILDRSDTQLGVQIIVEVTGPEDYEGVDWPYYIKAGHSDWPRVKAISKQVQRVLGFQGCLHEVRAFREAHQRNTRKMQLQFSYGHASKETPEKTRRVSSSSKANKRNKKSNSKGKRKASGSS